MDDGIILVSLGTRSLHTVQSVLGNQISVIITGSLAA